MFVVCGALAAGGCGIGSEGRAESVDIRIDGDAVPGADAEPSRGAQIIYLLDGPMLAEVRRDLTTSIGVRQLVSSLLAGPTSGEAAAGLSTAVPSSTLLVDASVEGGTATLDLSAEFTSAGGDREIAAVAQLVLTVTELPGVTAVRFLIDGSPIPVPRGDGSLAQDPVTASDYGRFLPG